MKKNFKHPLFYLHSHGHSYLVFYKTNLQLHICVLKIIIGIKNNENQNFFYFFYLRSFAGGFQSFAIDATSELIKNCPRHFSLGIVYLLIAESFQFVTKRKRKDENTTVFWFLPYNLKIMIIHVCKTKCSPLELS